MISINIKFDANKATQHIEKKLKALNQGIHEAGFILQAEIQQDIASFPSVDTGHFLQSVQTNNSQQFKSVVYSDVEYAIFLEEGTSAHFISPVNKKALRWKGGNEWFFSKGHMVSGIKPRKHFQRTALKMKNQIVQYIESEIKKIR